MAPPPSPPSRGSACAGRHHAHPPFIPCLVAVAPIFRFARCIASRENPEVSASRRTSRTERGPSLRSSLSRSNLLHSARRSSPGRTNTSGAKRRPQRVTNCPGYPSRARRRSPIFKGSAIAARESERSDSERHAGPPRGHERRDRWQSRIERPDHISLLSYGLSRLLHVPRFCEEHSGAQGARSQKWDERPAKGRRCPLAATLPS